MAHTRNSERQPAISTLLDLGRLLNSFSDPAEALIKLVDEVVAILQAEDGWLTLTDPEINHFSHRAAAFQGHELITGYMLTHGQPILVNPGDSLAVYLGKEKTADFALAYVPLLIKSHALGVMGVVDMSGVRQFTQHDLELLNGISGYAALIAENVRLHEQSVRRMMDLCLLIESANAISLSYDLTHILNTVTRYMTRGLHTHGCIISTWDPLASRIYKLAEYRLAFWPYRDGPLKDLTVSPFHMHALTTVEPFTSYFDKDDITPEECDCLDDAGCCRMIILPLQAEGRLLGLVEVSNLHRSDPFSIGQVSRSRRVVHDMARLLAQPNTVQLQKPLLDATHLLLDTVDADWCTIYTWEEGGNTLTYLLEHGSGIWPAQTGPTLDILSLPTLRVVLEEQRLAVLHSTDPDIIDAERLLFVRMQPATVLALPLVFKAETVGLAQLYDINPDREFSARELGMANALANQAASALANM